MAVVDRMIRAAKLEPALYEEVESDPSAMTDALIVVVLSALATGIGLGLRGGPRGLIFATVMTLFTWVVWAGLTYLIGTWLLPEAGTKADFGQLLRTIGLANAPGVVRILAIIPSLAYIAYAVAGIWTLVAVVVAVRQALDYQSQWRALGVVVIGWLILMFVHRPFVGQL
jgi:hypothetical protein